jgi:hypothetical protein
MTSRAGAAQLTPLRASPLASAAQPRQGPVNDKGKNGDR